jgi:hypothetical protein
MPASWRSHASHGRRAPTTRFNVGVFAETWHSWTLAWMAASAAMTGMGHAGDEVAEVLAGLVVGFGAQRIT